MAIMRDQMRMQKVDQYLKSLDTMANEEEKNWKLEFDFGDDKNAAETGEIVDFSAQQPLGACPKCAARVFEYGKNYVCEKSVPTAGQPTPSCDFKTGQIILQQPIERTQMHKLLETGKTDLLDKFVSMRTRRAFKAFLAWDAKENKVVFEFEPRTSKFPPRKTAGAAAAAPASSPACEKSAADKKLAGAAKKSHIKKCMADAKTA